MLSARNYIKFSLTFLFTGLQLVHSNGDFHDPLTPIDRARIFQVPSYDPPRKLTPPNEDSHFEGADIPTDKINEFNLPRKKSLRYLMSKPKSQGSTRGTCSVFAAVALAEFAARYKLSQQFVAKLSLDKDAGTVQQRLNWMTQNGVVTRRVCKYHPVDRDHIPNNVNSMSRVPVSGETFIYQCENPKLVWGENFSLSMSDDDQKFVNFIRYQIAAGRPVAVASYLPGKWWNAERNQDLSVLRTPSEAEYDEWRYSDNNCDINSCMSHAYVIVGYDDEEQTFTIKNSWGPNWKDGGFAKITYGYLKAFYIRNPAVALESAQSYSNLRGSFPVEDLHQVNQDFEFMAAKNGDLYAVKKRWSENNSAPTELHVYSKASNFKVATKHTQTSLPATGENHHFCLNSNNDLVVIRKAEVEGDRTDICVLSADSNYQQCILRSREHPHGTPDTLYFCMAPDNDDLFVIKTNGIKSCKTEVHVLSCTSGYREYSQHFETALHPSQPGIFEFGVKSNRDLVAIKKCETGTDQTEVHTLSAADGYKSYTEQAPTAIRQVKDNFCFAIGPNDDIYAIEKYGHPTKRPVVHVLKNVPK